MIRLSQQQHTAIGSDLAAVEIHFNNTAINTWKFKRFLVTFRPGGPFLYSLFALLII